MATNPPIKRTIAAMLPFRKFKEEKGEMQI
jgi:hypothetical protein